MSSFALMNSAATSDSDANDKTWWIMTSMMCNAPLFVVGCPRFGLFFKNKCFTVLMRAFSLER